MGYTKDTIKGISWMGTLRFATRGFALVRSAILARLLAPSQIGAFGIATLSLSLLEVLSETGVNVVLVQEKENIDAHINSAWVVSILRGIIIWAILFFASPLIATFFKAPDALLLLQMVSITPLIRGFINPSVVKFQKDLLFHKEFYYRLSIYFVDALATIIMTFVTQSPIGIAFGLIAGALYEVLISFIIVKPVPIPQIDTRYFHKIFHRGKWVSLGGVFNYLFYNFDNIVVGRMLGTGPLGLYQMAYTFSFIPISEVTDVFSKVTFPVYGKIAEDKNRLRKAFLKTTGIITLLSVPLGLILFFFPKEIISIILGIKWLGASSALQVLAIFGVVRAISGSTSALFLALGRQKEVAQMTFVNIAVMALTIVPLVNKFGMVGAGIAALIGACSSVPLILYYLRKVLR